MEDIKKSIDSLQPSFFIDRAKTAKENTIRIDEAYLRLQQLADQAKDEHRKAHAAIDNLTKIKLESDMLSKSIFEWAKEIENLTAPF